MTADVGSRFSFQRSAQGCFQFFLWNRTWPPLLAKYPNGPTHRPNEIRHLEEVAGWGEKYFRVERKYTNRKKGAKMSLASTQHTSNIRRRKIIKHMRYHTYTLISWNMWDTRVLDYSDAHIWSNGRWVYESGQKGSVNRSRLPFHRMVCTFLPENLTSRVLRLLRIEVWKFMRLSDHSCTSIDNDLGHLPHISPVFIVFVLTINVRIHSGNIFLRNVEY